MNVSVREDFVFNQRHAVSIHIDINPAAEVGMASFDDNSFCAGIQEPFGGPLHAFGIGDGDAGEVLCFQQIRGGDI